MMAVRMMAAMIAAMMAARMMAVMIAAMMAARMMAASCDDGCDDCSNETIAAMRRLLR